MLSYRSDLYENVLARFGEFGDHAEALQFLQRLRTVVESVNQPAETPGTH